MPDLAEIIVITLLAAQCVLLMHVRNLLIVMTGNQKIGTDQAREDAAIAASRLKGADTRRQDSDGNGGDVVKTRGQHKRPHQR